MSWSRKTMSDTGNKSSVVVLMSLFEIAKPTPASFVSPNPVYGVVLLDDVYCSFKRVTIL